MPFWSSVERVQRIIATVPAFHRFTPVELAWDEFLERWLPGLEKDGLRVGVNWTGPRATGYDLSPSEIRRRFEPQDRPTSAE